MRLGRTLVLSEKNGNERGIFFENGKQRKGMDGEGLKLSCPNKCVAIMCICCSCLMAPVKCSIVASVGRGDPREVLGCHRSPWCPAPQCPTSSPD